MQRNYRYFFLFVLSAMSLAAYIGGVCVADLLDEMDRHADQGDWTGRLNAAVRAQPAT